MKKILFVLAGAALLAACSGDQGAAGPTGPVGPTGPTGPTGPAGTSVGSLSGLVKNGANAAAIAGASVTTIPATSAATTAADGGYAIANVPVGVYTVRVAATGFETKQLANVSVVAGGTATADVQLLAPAATVGSVSGVVKRRAADGDPNAAVAGATVVLIGADAVAASPSEAPLEALAASSTLTATTDAAGAFVVANVPPGRYFVHAAPAAADLSVFPGGDASRSSIVVAAGQVATQNVVLSQRAPAAATFVGSSACLVCHNATHGGWKKSLHALVYRKPGEPSANQDMSDLPNKDKGLGFFVDGNAADNTGAGDELGLRISRTDSGASGPYSAWPAGYNVLLGKDATGYFFQTESTDKTKKSQKYYAAFTFGGHGIYKQRWVTRVKADKSYQACATTPCTDWSYFVSPVQYDEQLQPGVQAFHPYNGANWGAPAADGGVALVATQDKSFDLNCAGCHFTGNKLSRDASGNFEADAVNDPNGPIDYDGDGTKDEIVVGCEACHGAGSAHASGPARGKNILVPTYLSAERANQLCGNCHTRGVGKGTFTKFGAEAADPHTEYPSKGSNATVAFAYPGMGRAEFLADYHTDGLGTFNDMAKSARQHHQQGNDMHGSTHAKNQFELLSCQDCHDLHGRPNGPSLSMSNEDNKLCLSCHAPFGFGLTGTYSKEAEGLAVSGHMAEYAGMWSGYDPTNLDALSSVTVTGGVGQCTTCHMPKTAASQSRWVHEQVSAGQQPTGPRVRGDVSSHQFRVVRPATSETVFRNFASNNQVSNSCGSCHNTIAGVAPNYTW